MATCSGRGRSGLPILLVPTSTQLQRNVSRVARTSGVQPVFERPLQQVGQDADEAVGLDPEIFPMVDGPYPHEALEGAESLLHPDEGEERGRDDAPLGVESVSIPQRV